MNGLSAPQKILAKAIAENPQGYIDFLKSEGVVLDNPSLFELNREIITPMIEGDDAYVERLEKWFDDNQYNYFDVVLILQAAKVAVVLGYKGFKDAKNRTADKWSAIMADYQSDKSELEAFEKEKQDGIKETIDSAKSEYKEILENQQKQDLVTAGYVFSGLAVLLVGLYYLSK